MCLEIKSGPHIAEKDIKVYKVGNIKRGKFHPFWHGEFGYCKNTLTEKVTLQPIANNIYEGYHAYLYKNERLDLLPRHKCQSFIIPKGTTFYLGTRKDIVAEQIIWTNSFISRIFKTLKHKLNGKNN